MLKLRKGLYFILILAAILRLTYFFVFSPPLDWENGKTFHIAAENIILGKGYSLDGENPFIAREPGYSLFFLAPIYVIFGPSVFTAQIFQIILTIIIILIIFLISREYFSEKVGLIAGFIFAVYPPLVAFSGELLSETFFTFLILFFVFIILQSIKKESKKICFAGGIILGMAALTKSIAVFLPVFLIPFFLIKLKKEGIKYFLLICLGIILAITPYVIRNRIEFGRFIYNRDDFGLIMWAGSYIPWDGEFRGNNAFPLPDLTKGLDSEEADDKLRGLAFENIKENPLGVLKIWLKKPARLLFKPEFKSVLERENNFAFFAKMKLLNPDLLKNIFLAVNVLIIGLAIAGALFVKRVNEPMGALLLLILAYFIIALLPIAPDVRYKLPLMPYFFILDGVGLSYIFGRINKK